PSTRVRDLAEEDLVKIREYVDANLQTEGDLRISRSAGYAPASRGIECELRKRNSDSGASAGMEFRKRNSKVGTIRASANCGHPRKRGCLGWQ
ncbi:hypothetical protein ACWD4X_27525, partial [Streptomyces termitum]